jgi:hypothetical protein
MPQGNEEWRNHTHHDYNHSIRRNLTLMAKLSYRREQRHRTHLLSWALAGISRFPFARAR